jgi:ATP-binding cassette subfamily F protein 3
VQALNDYPGAVILISHDRHLIEASVDRLLLVADGTVSNFDGDMDDYRKLIVKGPDTSNGKTEGDASKNSAQDRRRESAAKRSELAPLRKKIKETESLMEKLQKEIQKLDTALADVELYVKDPSKATTLAKQRADAVRTLGEREEHWLEMSAEYETAVGVD